MELVTKNCINCHNFIFCYEDADTKCQMCNYTIPVSAPLSNLTRLPSDILPHRYPLPGGIRIEYGMPDAGTQQQRIKELEEINAEMLEALEGLATRFIDLVRSGDCGFWAPEEEEYILSARAAIAKARGEV